MKFFVDCTVLTTHTKDNKLVEKIGIDKGVITEVAIFFPSGCHGRVYAKVIFQGHQIMPRNQEAWAHGNNGWSREYAEIDVIAAPLKCVIHAYADNTDFNHTITICIEISPFSSKPVWDEVLSFIRGLSELIGIETPAGKYPKVVAEA